VGRLCCPALPKTIRDQRRQPENASPEDRPAATADDMLLLTGRPAAIIIEK